MDILIADEISPPAAAVARVLEAQGYTVRTCGDADEPGGVRCASLRGADCPLDTYQVDVAVSVGPDADVDRLGDGDVCALRRRIPLVLVDRPHDRLRLWAAAETTASEAAQAVRQVSATILPMHSARARLAIEDELHRQGLDDRAVEVEVRRRHGGLAVELFAGGSLTRRGAEALGVHIAQCLRRYDPWAKGIDVSVRGAAD
jgi:hypothetical protein